MTEASRRIIPDGRTPEQSFADLLLIGPGCLIIINRPSQTEVLRVSRMHSQRNPISFKVVSMTIDASTLHMAIDSVSSNSRQVDRLFVTRPLPEILILDHGSEFSGTALDAWATPHGVHLYFIHPGKPAQNAFIESFNGKFGDECLSEHWFLTLQEAQRVIEAWRREYHNGERTHSTIGDVTPMEFINHHQERSHTAQDLLRTRIYPLHNAFHNTLARPDPPPWSGSPL